MEEKDPKTRKEKKGREKGVKAKKKGEFGKYTTKAARIKLQHGNVHKYLTEIQFGENFSSNIFIGSSKYEYRLSRASYFDR